MFRSSTIISEHALNLAKVIFTLKHSAKLRRCLLSDCVAACHRMAYVACCAECTACNTHAILRHAATQSHNKQRRNFAECFNVNITLTRFSASSLMMVEDR